MTKRELLERIEKLQQEVFELERRVKMIEANEPTPVGYIPSQWPSQTAKPPFQPPYEITCSNTQ